MRHEIIFATESARDFKTLRSGDRALVREAIEIRLRFEPQKESKSRIKRLRGMAKPQYRLRAGQIRIFYDVNEGVVEILAVVPKPAANSWLEREGEKS